MSASKPVTCKINGKPITVESGTTVLEAARAAGADVPHFCWHPGLSRPANCRMCLVAASNSPKPIPSCYISVAPDIDYTTDSEQVRELRRAILEFILLNHPIDCAICDQAGECELQDNYFSYSVQDSRLLTGKVHKPKALPLSDKVMFDGERCIVCTRCVRFCDEIAKSSEIGVVNRGEHSEISLFPGRTLSNPYSMNIVDICPVGALTSMDFRFKCRVWFMETTESVCDQCARGCSVHLDHHKGEVMRYRPRENRQVNDWWMCDNGRLSYKGIHLERVLAPIVHRDGRAARAGWTDAIDALRTALHTVPSGKVALAVSATLDNEALYAVRRLRTEVLPQARVYATARPDGSDQDDILIRNDKNPNRRGLLAIFGEAPTGLLQPAGLDALAADVDSGAVTHVLVFGGQVPAAAVAKARFVATTTVHADDLAQRAQIVLPLQSHAEHDGTYVNFAGQVQRFLGGIQPVGEAEAGWRIVARIAKALGQELRWASDGAVFKALAADERDFAGMTHFNLGTEGKKLGSGEQPAPAPPPMTETPPAGPQEPLPVPEVR